RRAGACPPRMPILSRRSASPWWQGRCASRLAASTLVGPGQTLIVKPGTAHWFGNVGPDAAVAHVEIRPALRMEELLERSGAVGDISLTVPDGTILALLGPNGAGKTTTVRLLAGLLAPTAGEASVAGCDVRSEPAAVRSRVGLMTDSPGLHDQMTPVGYLNFF